jgi:hypothetical protein
MGVLQDVGADDVRILTNVTEVSQRRAILAGRLRLDPAHGYEEIGRRPHGEPTATGVTA